jgi:hypothetical protein
MFATYLRLDVTVHDNWRTVVRAAARKLKPRSRRNRAHRAARHAFYREVLAHHDAARRLVRTWRL